MTARTAPAHLGEPERKVWDTVLRDYAIEDAPGLALLTQALEAHQLARECREAIARDGLLPGGKAHPLLVTLRDARKCFAVILRQMNFDLAPESKPGRPSGR